MSPVPMNSRDKIVRFLVYAVLILFAAGVGYASYLTNTAGSSGAIPTPATDFIIAVSAILSGNLGVYFGVSMVIANWDKVDPIGHLQKVACWVYVVMLAVAAIAWAVAGFPEDAPLLPKIVTTGLGVVLAVFGAALGVKIPSFAAMRARLRAEGAAEPATQL